MSKVALKQIGEGGLVMQIPEVWEANVDTYTEPDGRDCVMVEISAEEGDPRSIVVSYGPMPEGSDSFIEASDTYEELIGEIGDNGDDEDPICEYDFLGTVAFGFEVPTEDGLACNFICAETGPNEGDKTHLFTILTTAASYEDIDDLLDLVEQNISFK